MNQRALYIVLLVQALFAGALLYAGYCSRETRKVGYLELTHRVTAGQASEDDFDKLAGFLPETADKLVVRSLFGLPPLRATSLDLSSKEKLQGDLWIYYPLPKPTVEHPPLPVDSIDVEKLSGPVPCFVVSFDARGRATWQKASVVHPIQVPATKVPAK